MSSSSSRWRLTAAFIVVAAVAALNIPTESRAETSSAPGAASLAEAGARVLSVEGMDSLFASCPADIWRTRGASLRERLMPGSWTLRSCLRDFDDCVSACTDRGSGIACRRVARVIEVHGMPDGDLARRRAYALSCALGDPSGCTNRGANIRNAAVVADSASQVGRETRDLCLFRTFEIACAADDA